MLTAKTQSQKLRAKSQEPPFSHTTATYPDDGIQSRSAAVSTLQVVGGRGNWDPNGRPQTTGVQAVSGFPISQLLLLTADPPAPLPLDQLQYRIREMSLSIDKFCTYV